MRAHMKTNRTDTISQDNATGTLQVFNPCGFVNAEQQTLAARVLVEEHRIYSEAICLLLDDKVRFEGRRVLRK